MVRNILQWLKFYFEIDIFWTEVKVTQSLNFVSFETVLLVDYECKIWSFYILLFYMYGQSKHFYAIESQTRQKDRRAKNNIPET